MILLMFIKDVQSFAIVLWYITSPYSKLTDSSGSAFGILING